jgi:hypothetical protein
MLSSELIASRIELKKSKSLESLGSQPIVSKTISNFHWSPKILSRVTLTGKNSHIISQKAFSKALEHDCFYDVIKEDDKFITIAFLPFSISPDKVHLLTNGLKNFYITRILFHKTMTKKEFVK